MKFVTLFIVCVLTTTGCAKNRGLTNDTDNSAHNREVALAILCGLGGHAMDSSGKCDYSKKSANSNRAAASTNSTYRAESNSTNSANNQLTYACGSAGMGANFVTGNCVNSNDRDVNPRNVVSPSIPLPQQSSQEVLMRCGALGKGADFVTGRCY